MISEHSSYRSYLKAVLATKTAANPRYSLRAFAGKLGLGPSTLSEVLNGKKNLSPESAHRVARVLGLNSRDSQYFTSLVQYESASDPEFRSAVLRKLELLAPKTKLRDLSLDAFQMLAEWYHLPILEYAQLDGVNLDAEGASAALGISKIEAQAAIERLERLQLLERDADGILRRVSDTIRVESPAPNLSLRRFHQQMLHRALASVEHQNQDEKVIGSETMAFDPDQLEEVRQLSYQFLDSVAALAAKSKRRTRVYHLGVQFFNLTRKQKKP